MINQSQDKKIKCPHCGWIRTVPIRVIEEAGTTDVVKGIETVIKNIGEKLKAALSDTQLNEANSWIDMPRCPNCSNTYQYNTRTGETRK
jgi:phage FluMu protein Com